MNLQFLSFETRITRVMNNIDSVNKTKKVDTKNHRFD